MRDVLNISTLDIMIKYANKSISDFETESSNRYSTLCHVHNDTTPSLKIYDKTEQGEGWDYHCFVCGAHGNNIDMLLDLGVASSRDEAVSMLRKDFDLELPTQVTLEHFLSSKGLSMEFCEGNGLVNTQAGVEIPYLNREHEHVQSKIRVKYEGKNKYYFKHVIKGAKTIPYGLHWYDSYDNTKEIFIVEGETDALTLRQAGYQVIGLQSASIWDEYVVELLEPFDKTVLCRDNDTAGLELAKKMKESLGKRFYTIEFFGSIKDVNDFFAMKCKGNMETFQESFDDLVRLPASYEALMVEVSNNPKVIQNTSVMTNVATYIDNPVEMDFMVSTLAKETGVSKRAIRSAVESSFKHTAKEQADEIISDTLIVRNNAYYKNVIKNDIPVLEQVSNFIIRPVKIIDSDGEIIRVLKLINIFGKISRAVVFTPEELAIPQKFTARCMGAGDYIFKGSSQDLNAIIELIFGKQLTPILSPKQIGRMADGTWLFKSFGVGKTGEIVPVDEEGIVNFGEDSQSYMPASVVVGEETADGSGLSIPDMEYNPDYDINEGRKQMAEFLRATYKSFGTFGVFNAFGWALAGVISHHIFEEYKMFPYLFIAGKRNSGKTTLAGIVYEFYGFGQHKISSIESPSNVGIIRTLSYMSSLPVAYDDYRNTAKIKYKDNLLLDIYNRHSSVKGTNTSSSAIRQEHINGFALISGEDIPANNALRTRCVITQISAHEGVRSHKGLETLTSYIPEAQRFLVAMMQKYQSDAEVQSALTAIRTLSDTLLDTVDDQRYALNHAIFAGMLLHELGDYITADERKEFLQWLTLTSADDKLSADETHSEALFLNDICDLYEQGILTHADMLVSGDELYLRFRVVYKHWSKYLKQTGTDSEIITESTLKSYLAKESFSLGGKRAHGMDSFNGYIRVQAYSLPIMAEQYPELVDRLHSFSTVNDEY